MDFKIIEINTDLDHIHLLISCKPQHYIPTIVKRLKGTSARLLFKLYPELKKELSKKDIDNEKYASLVSKLFIISFILVFLIRESRCYLWSILIVLGFILMKNKLF